MGVAIKYVHNGRREDEISSVTSLNSYFSVDKAEEILVVRKGKGTKSFMRSEGG